MECSWPHFDELADPRLVAGLAAPAEERRWDGLFRWDHIRYSAPTRDVADPWIALSAAACATERLVLGPLVTPLARRRVQKLARETVSSTGSATAVSCWARALAATATASSGPSATRRIHASARLLDQGLERLALLWGSDFQPPPVQRPRNPI